MPARLGVSARGGLRIGLAVLLFATLASAAFPRGGAFLDLFRSREKPAVKSHGGPVRLYAEAAYLSAQGQSLAAIVRLERAVESAPGTRFFRIALAQAHLDLNNPDGAETALEPLVASGPGDADVLRLQARLALLRNRYDEAIEFYEHSLVSHPENIRALQSLAILYADHAKDLEKAKEVCQRILSLDGRNLTALLYLAEAAALTDDIELSVEMFGRLFRYRPQFVDRLDELAQRLVQRGKKNQALYLYRQGVLMQPTSELLQRGFESLAADNDTTATLQAYRSLLEEAPRDIEIIGLLARRLMQARQWDEAEAQYRTLLGIHPDHPAALAALAEIALQQGEIEVALRRFEVALERQPDDPQVYTTAARLHIARGELDKAGQLLRRALTLGGNHPAVLVLLADLHERQGQWPEAERRFKEAIDALPANETLLGLLAGFYSRQDRESDAAEILEQMLAIRPRDLALYAQLLGYYLGADREKSAELLIQRGRKQFEDTIEFDLLAGQLAARRDHVALAEACFRSAVQTDPASLDARILLAGVLLTLSQDERAVEVLEEADPHLRDTDHRFAWRLALGGVQMQRRQWDKAVEQFHEAKTLNPEEFSLHAGLVESLHRAGKTEEASRILNETVRRFMPDHPREVQLLRAHHLQRQKENERARSLVEALAREHPEDVEILVTLAILHGEADNLDEAERLYRKVMRFAPESATAYNNLGYLFAEKNIRLDEAKTLVLEALERQPGAAYILDSLGWVYYRQGDLEKALEHLEQARRRSPPDPEIYEHLGDVHRDKGNRETAIDFYRKALALDPDNDDLRAKLDELRAAPSNASSARRN